MRKFLLLILLMTGAVCVSAQDSATMATETVLTTQEPVAEQQSAPKVNLVSVKFDMRGDWEYNVTGDSAKYHESGFRGRHFFFVLDGNITKKLSYHFRYRFHKINTNFYEATDWIYFRYDFNPRWALWAGKQLLLIGGYEYDRNPIDVYQWTHVGSVDGCYQFGVTGQYTTKDNRHKLQLQIANSPFTPVNSMYAGLYSYNFAWYGDMNWFQTIYSANMFEYSKGKFMNMITLGNKFIAGPVDVELDYTNRYYLGSKFFGDFSLSCNVIYNFHKQADVFVKAGLDYNKLDNDDTWVDYKTNTWIYGLGVEYYPLKETRDLRIHAYCNASNDDFKKYDVGIGCRWTLRAFEK